MRIKFSAVMVGMILCLSCIVYAQVVRDLGDEKKLKRSDVSVAGNVDISSGKEYTIKLGNDVELEMIWVAGGSFDMGSNSSDAYSNEQPVHRVTLDGYWIGKYEVTQAQYKTIMGANPSMWKGDTFPVEKVNWNDCREFIREINSRTGSLGITFSLPTEAQWEYAARGGAKSRGYKYSGSDDLDDVAWYISNSGDKYLSNSIMEGLAKASKWEEYRAKRDESHCKTHIVGQKQFNELGLYDMSGNVWEWCADWYDSKYYSKSPKRNPENSTLASVRVLRGGSWFSHSRHCRSAYRYGYGPDGRGRRSGFRLVAVRK